MLDWVGHWYENACCEWHSFATDLRSTLNPRAAETTIVRSLSVLPAALGVRSSVIRVGLPASFGFSLIVPIEAATAAAARVSASAAAARTVRVFHMGIRNTTALR